MKITTRKMTDLEAIAMLDWMAENGYDDSWLADKTFYGAPCTTVSDVRNALLDRLGTDCVSWGIPIGCDDFAVRFRLFWC